MKETSRLPLYLLLCITLCTASAVAQSISFLDSAREHRRTNPELALLWARKALARAGDESQEANCFLQIGSLHSDLSGYDSAHYFLRKALETFKAQVDSVHISETFENIGIAFEFQSRYNDALAFYDSAYQIRKSLGLKREQAYSLNSIGNIEVLLNNYPVALERFHEALKLGQGSGDDQLITNAYNNIGNVYDYNNDLDKALEYYLKAKAGFEKLGNSSGLAGALNNIGLVYKNMGQPAKSIPTYQEALAIFTRLKSHYGVAVLQNNLGVAYGLMNDFDTALRFHEQSLRTNSMIDNLDGVSNSNNSIGECYLRLGNYNLSREHYLAALSVAKEIKSRDRMAEAYEGLSKTSEQMNDYKTALQYFREAKVLRDSILTADKFQKLYDMEQKYESAVKERRIALLNAESAKQKFAIAEQQQLISKRDMQLVLVMSSIVLLGLIVYLFYSRLTLIQKAKVQAMESEKKQAIIQSIYEQRISISKDMHDEIGSGLTHIAMLSELVTTGTDLAPRRKEIETISEIARKLTQSMSEIVWALNPQNETLENLVAYLREQTNRYFEPFPVLYTMDVPEVVPDKKLTNIHRRNLFLVAKETLNNTLKHSQATQVKFSIAVTDDLLTFHICDNGKGFDIERIRRSANGLRNMKGRMEEIGGTFDIRSEESGTTVSCSVTLNS